MVRRLWNKTRVALDTVLNFFVPRRAVADPQNRLRYPQEHQQVARPAPIVDNTNFCSPWDRTTNRLDWYEDLVSVVAIHTSFDSINSDALARIRNECIKQARALSVYDQLTPDTMLHAVLDVIRIRVEQADILGQVFVDSGWQNKVLKAHDLSRGIFGNHGLSLTDYIRQFLSLTGVPQTFSLPHSFQ